jgi:hypothetical protein
MIADPEGPSFITRTVGRRRYADDASGSHDPELTSTDSAHCRRSICARGRGMCNEPYWLSLIAEAPQSRAMPLRLRRAADQFRRAHWEPSNEHLVILSGETVEE